MAARKGANGDKEMGLSKGTAPRKRDTMLACLSGPCTFLLKNAPFRLICVTVHVDVDSKIVPGLIIDTAIHTSIFQF